MIIIFIIITIKERTSSFYNSYIIILYSLTCDTHRIQLSQLTANIFRCLCSPSTSPEAREDGPVVWLVVLSLLLPSSAFVWKELSLSFLSQKVWVRELPLEYWQREGEEGVVATNQGFKMLEMNQRWVWNRRELEINCYRMIRTVVCNSQPLIWDDYCHWVSLFSPQ